LGLGIGFAWCKTDLGGVRAVEELAVAAEQAYVVDGFLNGLAPSCVSTSRTSVW
jgi:hypothetical protein